MREYQRREIREALPEAALYESLGEEAAELAHAALKLARRLRGDNPTPVLLPDARANVREEYTDVRLVAEVLGLEMDNAQRYSKGARWLERLGLSPGVKSVRAVAFGNKEGGKPH